MDGMNGMKDKDCLEKHGVDDPLSEKVIGLCYAIQNELGHGFLESVYHKALQVLLRESGIPFQVEVPFPVQFHGVFIGEFRADIVVESRLLLELKATNAIVSEHVGQTLNYLKISAIPNALLVNFGKPRVEIRRIHNPFRNSLPL